MEQLDEDGSATRRAAVDRRHRGEEEPRSCIVDAVRRFEPTLGNPLATKAESMSRRNGDRARFQKERKRKMLRRQRLQAFIKAGAPDSPQSADAPKVAAKA
jgi:hypothetical protein